MNQQEMFDCPKCAETEREWKRDFLVVCILGLFLQAVIFTIAVKEPESAGYRVKIVKVKSDLQCTHEPHDRLN